MKVLQKIWKVLKGTFFFIWGLPQNFVGGIMYLALARKAKSKTRYKDSFVLQMDKNIGAVSLGMFIFLFSDYGSDTKEITMHEYGHSIQSKILGPLYLLVIGLPSIIWAGLFEKYRTKHKISYYSFFTEKWANKLVGLSEEDL